MASSVPERSSLTYWLAGLFTEAGLTVGLMRAPEEGGWNDDPAQTGNWFQEYIVLTPMDSDEPSGSLGDPSSEWNLPYSLMSYGVNYDQVEGQADKARRIVNGIRKQVLELGEESWSVMSCRIQSLGGANLNRDAEPDEYQQRDVVMVRISKES